MNTTSTRFFSAYGKVQKVMFRQVGENTFSNFNIRQTVIRASIKRGLKAGATNDKLDKNKVDITLIGDIQIIDEMINKMKTGNDLNDWGANVCKNIQGNFTLILFSATKLQKMIQESRLRNTKLLLKMLTLSIGNQ